MTADPQASLTRYLVRVANPPGPKHRGFIAWAASEAGARAKIESHGYRVLSVCEQEIAV